MTRNDRAPGLIIAAPSSGSGKTTVTLALLRAFRQRGLRVASMKIGPDFIDPAFHSAASNGPCINLDDWAMSEATFNGAVARCRRNADLVLAEGVMGLFDGSGTGRGSTADVAARLGWPVVLVMDASGMSESAAALAQGFMRYRDDVNVAAVIVNRLGSARHQELIANALGLAGIPSLGHLLRQPDLELPSRHLGLVQAGEHPELEGFMDRAARWVAGGVDLDALQATALPGSGLGEVPAPCPLPPLGQRVAIARDAAFGFDYRLTLEGWQEQGAELSFFSPLADEPPGPDADAVYLPGGYPELHSARLADCQEFKRGVSRAAGRGAVVYGECGGFMVLGDALEDGDGVMQPMCGLLPVTTSFAVPKMTLGYRQLQLKRAGQLGLAGQVFRGHEFHFARTLMMDEDVEPLFEAWGAAQQSLGALGARVGNVSGSFAHLVDRVA